MAFFNCWPGLRVPPAPDFTSAPGTMTLDPIDDTAEKYAIVFRAPKTGSLAQMAFVLGTVAQVPTNGITLSFQDVGADGLPDGTADQSVTGVAPAANTALVSGALSATRSVTKGDLVAMVAEFTSFVAGDSVNFVSLDTFAPLGGEVYPLLFTASWAKQANAVAYGAVLYSGDTNWTRLGYNSWFHSDVSSTSITSVTDPNEIGNRFQVAAGVKVGGVEVHLTSAAGRSFTVNLYDSDNTTVLASTTVDTDQLGVPTVPTLRVPFTSDIELQPNTNYTITVSGVGATAVSVFFDTFEGNVGRFGVLNSELFTAVERVTYSGAHANEATVQNQFAYVYPVITAIDPVKGSLLAPGMLRNLAPFMRSFLR